MKLYFYILEQPYNGKPFVRSDECEVIKKPKTYYPVDRFPRGIYGAFVNKKDIGCISGYDNNCVILTENNPALAKEILTRMYESGVRLAEERLEKTKAALNAILEMEE